MNPPYFWIAVIAFLVVGVPVWLLLRRRAPKRFDQDMVELRKELGDVRFLVDGAVESGRSVRLPFEHGVLLLRQSRAAEAAERFGKALASAADELKPVLHVAVGTALYLAGRLTEAPSHLLKAARMGHDRQAKDVEAAALGNLGLVYLARAEKDKAQEHHLESLGLDREAGNAEGEAVNLGRLGLICQGQGKTDDALEYLEASLAKSRDAGFSQGEANALGRMALIHQVKGRLDKALDLCGDALKVARDAGLKTAEAELLGNVGLIHHAKGEQEKALGYLLPSLQLFMGFGGEVRALGAVSNLHQVYRALGPEQFAEACRKQTKDQKFIRKLLHLMTTVDAKVKEQDAKAGDDPA